MNIRWVLHMFAGVVLSAGLAAAENHLMHCFTFTPIESASAADWKAFYEATDAMPKHIPQVKMVWAGKLRAPQQLFQVDAEARKKLGAGEKDVDAKANRVVRSYGVCMAMDNTPDVLKAYTANPYHKTWMAAYEKVRVAGTTTFDIVGR
ncbi:MAG: hypothetical protein ACK5AZ_25125 [Bryobacteraceae bacterium]